MGNTDYLKQGKTLVVEAYQAFATGGASVPTNPAITDWYIWPFLNGSSEYYTATDQQTQYVN